MAFPREITKPIGEWLPNTNTCPNDEVVKDADGVEWKRYGTEGHWTEVKPHDDYPVRVRCDCGSLTFHVLYTGDYETSAKCVECGASWTVHTG